MHVCTQLHPCAGQLITACSLWGFQRYCLLWWLQCSACAAYQVKPGALYVKAAAAMHI
jgi:hypothetical protein